MISLDLAPSMTYQNISKMAYYNLRESSKLCRRSLTYFSATHENYESSKFFPVVCTS